MAAPAHLAWLVDTGKAFKTKEGRTVELWQLEHDADAAILSAWAKHFRDHYCDDALLDELIKGTGLTKNQFLIQRKFPDVKDPPGPSVRAGDFAEIVVADYIEYKLGYWCPRSRYDFKWNRNESAKGCDIIGFKFVKNGVTSANDELFVFESKAALSGKKAVLRLQDAVDDSHKDKVREAMTLSALKQRFIERGLKDDAGKVERFQDELDRPFKRISGAAALHDNNTFDATLTSDTVANNHFNAANLKLIVVTGEALMTLVNALYERAANEA
jgi:hypothetical protein